MPAEEAAATEPAADAPKAAPAEVDAETLAAMTGKTEPAKPITLNPAEVTEGVKAGQYPFNVSFEPAEVEGIGLVRSKFANEDFF